MDFKDGAETGVIPNKDETAIETRSGSGGVEAIHHVETGALAQAFEEIDAKSKRRWYAYFLTRDFYAVLILGQVLSLCITATNTFSTFLAFNGASIPAFQSLFNYIIIGIAYTAYTIYRYGFRKCAIILYYDWWRYIILSFMDVQGNYFTVLAYRFTTILSAQLINFWSIVCVVIVSFTILRVRYKWAQVVGILICCGGMGLLLASDHIQGTNGGEVPDQLKGDLFGLLGATFYGLSNVFEEWFVSKRPMYEVLAMLGVFGAIINGVQAAIFDRDAFAAATWTPDVGGWITGYTLALVLFYSLAPLILRMGSAAFFDISLLTSNFWGVIIGIHVFGLTIYFLYPIAFVLIIVGLVVYFLAGSMLGDSKKPWLGATQDDGIAGIGTAKRKALKMAEREGRLNGSHVV